MRFLTAHEAAARLVAMRCHAQIEPPEAAPEDLPEDIDPEERKQQMHLKEVQERIYLQRLRILLDPFSDPEKTETEEALLGGLHSWKDASTGDLTKSAIVPMYNSGHPLKGVVHYSRAHFTAGKNYQAEAPGGRLVTYRVLRKRFFKGRKVTILKIELYHAAAFVRVEYGVDRSEYFFPPKKWVEAGWIVNQKIYSY